MNVVEQYEKLIQSLKEEVKAEVKAELLAELKSEAPVVAVVDDWVGIDTVMEKTGWGRSTIEKWRDQGQFLTMRKSARGKVLYNLPDVLRFTRQFARQKKKPHDWQVVS